uniref:Secreted protein n=1 Tax=Ascaris lumbricoides TaxID=6252 RepID=A0A0M3I572_ASCLU
MFHVFRFYTLILFQETASSPCQPGSTPRPNATGYLRIGFSSYKLGQVRVVI